MSKQYATFYLENLYFGVEVLAVQEVIRHQPMTRVPLAPPTIEGLINLRGQIVTALDLRRTLDLPPRAADRLPMNVVVRAAEGALSLLVDEIGDVVEVQDDAFETVPNTLRPPVSDVVTGVFKLDGRLLLVLDVERTIAARAGSVN
jgi:purine-binding chemotaxis protein CheW